MSNSTPAPSDVLGRAIRVALKHVRVGLPGVIEAYDPTRCEASVQLQLLEPDRAEDGGRVMSRLPVINHVPVMFCGGGDGRLTFPVQRGDTCWVMFASSSISRWLALGGEVDPKDERHHHLSDAVALVALRDFAHVQPAHATATVLEGEDVRIGNALSAQPLATKADIDALTAKLNSLIAKFNAHLHTGVTTGGGVSGATQPGSVETSAAAATCTESTKAS